MNCYLDTNIFLNVIYNEPSLGHKSSSLLKRVQSGKLQGLTSSVTLLEVTLDMVESGFSGSAEIAVASIEDLPNLEIVALDKTMTKLAADYVVRENLTIHDAYHLATALCRKAHVFVTRDEDLVKKIEKYVKSVIPEEI